MTPKRIRDAISLAVNWIVQRDHKQYIRSQIANISERITEAISNQDKQYISKVKKYITDMQKKLTGSSREVKREWDNLANAIKLAVLSSDVDWEMVYLGVVNEQIDEVFSYMEPRIRDLLVSKVDSAYEYGLVPPIPDEIPSLALFPLDVATKNAILEMPTNLITTVVGEAKQRVKTEVALSMLAGESPRKAAKKIMKQVQGSFFKAERITRTEMLRAHSIANNGVYKRANEFAKENFGYEYKKRWLWSHKPDGRDGHEEAEAKYRDNPIPVDEPFQVRAMKTSRYENLMFPRDIQGSAANTINCGCVHVLVKDVNNEN